MKISDRADNGVIADVHPLLAAYVAMLADGDKTRVIYVSAFEAIVVNQDSFRTLARWPHRAPILRSTRHQ